MHISDALISPVVGGALWATSVGIGVLMLKDENGEGLQDRVVLSGVAGAFVFAAQMVNFTIPGTGSSGHLAGGLLLAVLLGPRLGYLTLASVLLIQSLLFADGGLLAFGCNVFNLAAMGCLMAYNLVYRPLMAGNPGPQRRMLATVLAAVVGLQAGAFCVVLETLASGRVTLPPMLFLVLMQGIHLAIGIVEGLVTHGILEYLRSMRPELVQDPAQTPVATKRILVSFAVMAVVISGGISLLASGLPDGLEWSLEKTVTGELGTNDGIHGVFESVQSMTARLPDYGMGEGVLLGSSAAGVIGAVVTLIVVWTIGWGYRQWWLKRS